ncbi:hypothetical protein Tco_1330490 [Tanacetum coccineum]
MGDENPIRTLGDYYKPSHEGYKNTIELPIGNNVCEIDRAADGKLRYKNADESWEIIKNLALYDHEGWNDIKEFVKPVKAISTLQSTLKTPDRRLLELEDQINFVLKGSRPTPRPSSTHTPQAYAKAVYLNPHPQNQNEPPKQNPFTFREPTGPNPQPQALGTTFEAQEINDRMTEMFRLLKELMTCRDLEKVLIREEAKFPITKNVNSISLTIGDEERSEKTDITTGNDFEKPTKTETKLPVKESEKEDETKNEPNRNAGKE